MKKNKNLKKISTFKVGVYLRLSVEEDGRKESDSINNQRQMINMFLRQHPDLVFVQEYVDDGYTGTNFNRPGFQQLIKDIEAGIINCVIVKDLSRFGRNHIDVEIYVTRFFKDQGVRFIAINDNYDTLENGYDMMFSIHNLFNEHYARDISSKSQSAFKAKQRAGEFIGAFASYGYMKSQADRHKLVIDPYAAKVVRRIFDMYLSGLGKVHIAYKLNEEGILCPSEYKRQQGLNYHNCNKLEKTSYWTYSTIHKILKNRMYTGDLLQGTTKREMHGRPYLLDEDEWILVENTHEPIIDKSDWEKVQKMLNIKQKNIDFDQNISIFAGLLKCADCGRAMAKTNTKRNGRKQSSFSCGTYKRSGVKFCTPHYISEEVLKKIVLDDLNSIISKVENLAEMIEEECEQLEPPSNPYNHELEQTEKALTRVKKLKQAVFEQYALGILESEEYAEYREKYTEEERNLKERISLLTDKLDAFEEFELLELPWVQQLLETGQLKELTREMLLETVEEIRIHEDKTVEIFYVFDDEYSHLLDVYGSCG